MIGIIISLSFLRREKEKEKDNTEKKDVIVEDIVKVLPNQTTLKEKCKIEKTTGEDLNWKGKNYKLHFNLNI